MGNEDTLQRVRDVLEDAGDEESIATQPLAERSLKNGTQWIFRDTFTLADAEDIELYAGVSSDSDDVMRIVGRTVEPDSAVTGEVQYNLDRDGTGAESLTFVNGSVVPDMNLDPDFHLETGGTYTNPDTYPTGNRLEGETIELPLRSALGTDPVGPTLAATRPPQAAVYRIQPGGSVRYRIESTAADNTVTVEFVVSQRPPAGNENGA